MILIYSRDDYKRYLEHQMELAKKRRDTAPNNETKVFEQGALYGLTISLNAVIDWENADTRIKKNS